MTTTEETAELPLEADPVTLNWGKGHTCQRHHWSKDAKPCGHCGGDTHLRNCAGRPSHKVCAERAATAELAAAQRRAGVRR